MPWSLVAPYLMAGLALLAAYNERRQRKASRTKGVDEIVNDRIKLLLTGGPAAVLGEYDDQGQVLLERLRHAIAERDTFAADLEEVRAQVGRLERQATENAAVIGRLQRRIDELERTNGHV